MLFLANITEIPVISVTAELKSLKWDSKWLQVISVLGSLNKKESYILFIHGWHQPEQTLALRKRTDQYCQVKSQRVIGIELPYPATQNSTLSQQPSRKKA